MKGASLIRPRFVSKLTISHRHRFIFLPVPKTGTTSIQRMLLDHGRLDEDGKIKLCWRKRLHHRVPARRLYRSGDEFNRHRWALKAAELAGPRIWKDYFSFGFARNPWDRMVSFYHYELETGAIPRDMEFSRYVSDRCTLVAALSRPGSGYSNLLPCWRWVKGCDFVGRMERFDHDLATVLGRLGLSHLKADRLNTTNHRHYGEYYDDTTRDLVAKTYADDVREFGYTFEGPGHGAE